MLKPWAKDILIISAKNAVNAILTNGALMTLFGGWQQINTRTEWVQILHLTLACVVAREGMVWIPKLLAWSQSQEPRANSASAGK